MEIVKTQHYTHISGTDQNGKFKISVQNDCSQLRVESDFDDFFIDTNYRELKAIHNAIGGVLKDFERSW